MRQSRGTVTDGQHWRAYALGKIRPQCLPPHTHDRRSEVYLYFDVPDDHRVLHLMGEPEATRGLWVADGQAVLSPPWSIHCGVGTARYKFLWAMGGENQRFDDMDPAPIPTLR